MARLSPVGMLAMARDAGSRHDQPPQVKAEREGRVRRAVRVEPGEQRPIKARLWAVVVELVVEDHPAADQDFAVRLDQRTLERSHAGIRLEGRVRAAVGVEAQVGKADLALAVRRGRAVEECLIAWSRITAVATALRCRVCARADASGLPHSTSHDRAVSDATHAGSSAGCVEGTGSSSRSTRGPHHDCWDSHLSAEAQDRQGRGLPLAGG